MREHDHDASWLKRPISRRHGLAWIARAAAVVAAARLETIAVATARPASPGPVELPPAVRDALEQNARAIAPITLRWTTRARSVTPLEELARSLDTDPATADRWINFHRHHRVTFQDGSYRASHQEESREPLETPDLNESAFDGRFLYTGQIARHGGRSHTMYMKKPLAAHEEDDAQYLSTAPFEAMAIRLPVRVVDLREQSPVRSEILYMLERGAKLTGVEEVNVESRKWLRLRMVAPDPERTRAHAVSLDDVRGKLVRYSVSEAEAMRIIEEVKAKREYPLERTYVFHLDPALNFAVRRREESWGPNVPISRADCDGHARLAGRVVFVPRRFVVQSFNRKPLPAGAVPQAVQTHASEVTHAGSEPVPSEMFALAYNAPGTRVYVDNDEGRQVAYEVKEDGTLAPFSRGGARGTRG